jgi:hypothetical protein
MTYNSEHYPIEQVTAAKFEVSRLIQNQRHLLDFLREFLKATNGCTQLCHCYCFNELAIKIRLNMEAANELLPKLYEDYRFKTSINLIYRSIVDDLISVFYLGGFVLKNDPEQLSLKNELLILHKEFLNGTSEGIDADNEHLIYIHEMLEQAAPQIEDFKSEIIRDNPEIYENGLQKNNKKLRETSHADLQELLKETNGAGFITESKKLKFIALREPQLSKALTGLFKYLSQFQHYSPEMHKFVLSDADLDIQTYKRCLFHVLQMVDTLLQFIVVRDSDRFQQYFKELMGVIGHSEGDI